MARLTWHGHATFTVETGAGRRLMFDPFLNDNPRSDIRVSDVDRLDYILCTHGHSDHFADAIEVAKRTDATIIGTFELVAFAESNGARGHAMNIGGAHRFDFGTVKLTPAIHTATIHGDEGGQYTATPHGFLLHIDGTRLYNAGDTALTMDMQLLRGRVDVALLPIGDNYTMGPEDAVRAIEFIEPRVVIPMHYDTWDLIAQDTEHFRTQVGGRAEVVVLTPGSHYSF
jgi:L-ascorbate metabolism protein UlaG (beta-lactamase superfamily)